MSFRRIFSIVPFFLFLSTLAIMPLNSFAGPEDDEVDFKEWYKMTDYEIRKFGWVEAQLIHLRTTHNYQVMFPLSMLIYNLMSTEDINGLLVQQNRTKLVSRYGRLFVGENSYVSDMFATLGKSFASGSKKAPLWSSVIDSVHMNYKVTKELSDIEKEPGQIAEANEELWEGQDFLSNRFGNDIRFTLGQLFDYANKSEETNATFNKHAITADVIPVDLSQTPEDALAQLPASHLQGPVLKGIMECIKQGKNLEQYFKELKINVEDARKQLDLILKEHTKTSEELKSELQVNRDLMHAFFSNEQKRREFENKLRKINQDFYKLQNERSGAIFFISLLVSKIDKNAAQGIQKVGNGALAISAVLHKFNMGEIGEIALSANLFQIFTSLSEATQIDPTISRHQEIRDAFSSVHYQIRDLRGDMIQGFKFISKELDIVLYGLETAIKLVIDGKNRTLIGLEEVKSQVRDFVGMWADSEYVKSRKTFSDLFYETFGPESTIFESPLNETKYQEAYEAFSQYAQQTSYDGHISGSVLQASSPESRYRYLFDYPVERIIGFLPNAYVEQVGSDSFAKLVLNNMIPGFHRFQELPNPKEWAIGSEAVFQLWALNPEGRKTEKTLNALLDVGEHFKLGIDYMGSYELLSPLIDAYEKHIDEVRISANEAHIKAASVVCQNLMSEGSQIPEVLKNIPYVGVALQLGEMDYKTGHRHTMKRVNGEYPKPLQSKKYGPYGENIYFVWPMTLYTEYSLHWYEKDFPDSYPQDWHRYSSKHDFQGEYHYIGTVSRIVWEDAPIPEEGVTETKGLTRLGPAEVIRKHFEQNIPYLPPYVNFYSKPLKELLMENAIEKIEEKDKTRRKKAIEDADIATIDFWSDARRKTLIYALNNLERQEQSLKDAIYSVSADKKLLELITKLGFRNARINNEKFSALFSGNNFKQKRIDSFEEGDPKDKKLYDVLLGKGFRPETIQNAEYSHLFSEEDFAKPIGSYIKIGDFLPDGSDVIKMLSNNKVAHSINCLNQYEVTAEDISPPIHFESLDRLREMVKDFEKTPVNKGGYPLVENTMERLKAVQYDLTHVDESGK